MGELKIANHNPTDNKTIENIPNHGEKVRI